MGTRRLIRSAAIAAALLPASAAAQLGVIAVPGGTAGLYEGAVFELVPDVLSFLSDVETIELTLGSVAEVLLVRVNGGVVWSPETCQDSASGCFTDCTTCVPGLPVRIEVDPASGRLKFIVAGVRPSDQLAWTEPYVETRLLACGTGNIVTATFTSASTGPSPADADLSTPCGALSAITPSSVAAPRAVPAQPAAVTLNAVVGAAPAAPLRQHLFTAGAVDSAKVDALLACAGPPPAGFTSCLAPPFSDFMRLTVLSDNPVRLQLEAVNAVNPPAGDAAIRVLLGNQPTIALTVQQRAEALTITSDRSELGLGGEARIGVTGVTNAAGGEEPWDAQWTVTPAAAAGWLRVAEAGVALLTAPTDQTALGSITSVLVEAAHPTNPTLARDSVSIGIRAVADRASRCELTPARSKIGLGGRQLLELHIEAAGGLPLGEPIVPAWTAESPGGSLEVAADLASAVYVAPTSPEKAQVRVDFPPNRCPSSSVIAAIEVASDLRVRLESDKRRVEPGGVVGVTAHVTNATSSDIDDVTFRLLPGRDAKSLRRLPRGRGIEARPASATGVSGAAAAVPKTGATWTATLPPGAERVFELPLLARPGSSCGELTATVQAFRGSSETPIAEDSVSVLIACDPELSESTLFGKVFDDRNGDGEQTDDEPGIPSAVVATAQGVWATTDQDGRYHIARLAPGRHAVKLDPASLPLGARARGPWRHEVTLTPGLFTKASFAVELPRLDGAAPLTLSASGSGVRMVAGKPVYRARFGAAPDGSLSAARRGERQEARRDGEVWEVDLPIDTAAPHWLLTLRRDDGRVFLWSFAVHVYERALGDVLVLPWGPRPLARFTAPAPGATFEGDRFTLAGEVQSPAVLAFSTSATCGVEAKSPRAFRCLLPVGGSTSELGLRVDPAADARGDDPPAIAAALPVAVGGGGHFLVGLAGVEVGTKAGTGPEGGGWDAGGAFYYRGAVAEGVSLTAGADLRAQPTFIKEDGTLRAGSGIAARLFGHDPSRIFRDLDPESYYPTYGDGSTTVDEREAGGRFYARLQAGQSYLKWGAVNTAIDDVEAGRFVRSLYGFGARLHLGDGETSPAVRAVLFAAQPDSAAARDELEVTGGSLYFLSRRAVVEGSVRVTLEVQDEVSGLPIRAVPLAEGIDFEVDYAGGRLSLDSVLPASLFSGSITGAGSGAHRARLLVEYEYLTGDALGRDWSTGGRLVGRWGGLSLGVTGAASLVTGKDGILRGDSSYTLAGATARLDLGDPLRLRLELAQSQGAAHHMDRSPDGGLSWDEPQSAPGGGKAAVLELAGRAAGIDASVYGRLFQRGFIDSHHAGDTRLLQSGLRLTGEPLAGTTIWTQLDHKETRSGAAPLLVRDTALAGASQRLGDFRLALEARHTGFHTPAAAVDESRTAVAGQLGWLFLRTWTVSARRRQLLGERGDTPAGESSLGLLWSSAGGSAGLELGADDAMQPFGRAQGSVPVDGETELYMAYVTASRLSVDLGDSSQSGSSVVAGGRRSLEDGTRLYAEEQLRLEGATRGGGRRVGGETAVAAQTRLSFSYERAGRERSPDASPLARDAGALGIAWTGGLGTLQLGTDLRQERSDADRRLTWGAQGRGELYATKELALALSWRGASSWLGAEGAALGRDRAAWEGAAGFALRPVTDDRINAFGRYALLHERRDEGGAWLVSLSHIVAFALAVDVVGPVGITPKLSYRTTRVELAGADGASDSAYLAALRADLRLGEGWQAGLEGRGCGSPGPDEPTRFGALAELSVLTLDWLRLGAGYNLSEIATEGVRCNEPGARGAFVRAEAVY